MDFLNIIKSNYVNFSKEFDSKIEEQFKSKIHKVKQKLNSVPVEVLKNQGNDLVNEGLNEAEHMVDGGSSDDGDDEEDCEDDDDDEDISEEWKKISPKSSQLYSYDKSNTSVITNIGRGKIHREIKDPKHPDPEQRHKIVVEYPNGKRLSHTRKEILSIS